MAAAHVQLLGSNNSAASTTVISPSSKTVTVGNDIFVAVAYYGAQSDSVADSLGNTYTLVRRTNYSTDHNTALYRAPVTTGGSITSITVTQTAGYSTAVASEFSGVGTEASDGAGFGASTTTTATWDANKTIPANGIAIGVVGTGTSAVTWTAGSASGSPSTTPVIAGQITPSYASALVYAVPGSSDVTGFTGTATASATCTAILGAGANFNPAVVTPTWTTPADTVSMSTTPDLQFNSPTSASAQHFQLQLDTANTFNTGNLRTYDSSTSQTNWYYWNGSAWTAFPSTGLSTSYDGNEVRYSVTSALSAATWYRRVRAGTGT